MTDIVERLREQPVTLYAEAAAEIETLRASIENHLPVCQAAGREIETLRADNERLYAELARQENMRRGVY